MTLSERMKEMYEKSSRMYLIKKSDVILRLDGKAFHTYTRFFKKPYDAIFHQTMNETAKFLCTQIQGCKLAYTQSDEISLLLTDYDGDYTDAWFQYNVQKMCSVAASMASAFFNGRIIELARAYGFSADLTDASEEEYVKSLKAAINTFAFFDCRAFNIPHNEVVNCFIWRQNDCRRNAIQMLGQHYFSHRDIQNKSNETILEMLKEKGVNFEDMPGEYKNGVCCRKVLHGERKKWEIDKDIPLFTENRDYITGQMPIME